MSTGPRARRILFFDHTAKLGGGEIALLNLVRNLDAGRCVPIVALAESGPLVDRLAAAGIQTVVIPIDAGILEVRKDSLGAGALLKLRAAGAIVGYAWKLARFIRASRIDLIHTNSLKSDIIGAMAARLAGRKLAWHVRDRIADDYLPKRAAQVFRALCRLVPDRVIANSHATLATILLRHGSVDRGDANPAEREGGRTAIALANHARFQVVHDGTPLSPVEGRADLSPAHPLVGLVGRISPWKGQHVFLRAAAIVLRDFPNTRFQVIGAPLFDEQAYDEEIRRLAISLGIEQKVEFTGFRSDVPELISRLDLLVHASTMGEPFGQVVIEAMAAAKPVVATRGGGVPEIVREGITGLLVPMNDPEQLAAAIKRVLSSPSSAQAMGEAGRKRVEEAFSIGKTAAGVQAVFDGM